MKYQKNTLYNVDGQLAYYVKPDTFRIRYSDGYITYPKEVKEHSAEIIEFPWAKTNPGGVFYKQSLIYHIDFVSRELVGVEILHLLEE